MNFQSNTKKDPIKVLMLNPLVPSSQLILLKLLSGEIFSGENFIDLNLFVQSEEIMAAEVLKVELEKCAFSNASSIEISTNFPQVHDADIFCFMSDFGNPNYIDVESMENDFHIDTLYLLIKFANNLTWPTDEEEKEGENSIKRKPIFVADGLVALNILVSFSRNLPYDIFYSPSPIEAISKSVLGDYLNVQSNKINDVLVWGANDIIFHVEVEKPLIISDNVHNGSGCGSDTISKELLHSLKLDYTKFNSTWMRKEFLEKRNLYVLECESNRTQWLLYNIIKEPICYSQIICLFTINTANKVASSAARNPYGCIYKAAEFAKSLKQIWKARSGGSGMKVYSNMGVISDGSIGTVKGYPYFLPLVITSDTWEVNQSFAESTHLRQEMKRINKAVVEHHQKLIPYCKKVLEENKINLVDMPTDNVSSICDDSGRPSLLVE